MSLLSDPLVKSSGHDMESLAEPQETMGTPVAIARGAIASHVHCLSIYEGPQVSNMFQRGLEFVTGLFWKH